MYSNPELYLKELDDCGYEDAVIEARAKIMEASGTLHRLAWLYGFEELTPIALSLRDIAGKAILDRESRRKIRLEHTQEGRKDVPPHDGHPDSPQTLIDRLLQE